MFQRGAVGNVGGFIGNFPFSANPPKRKSPFFVVSKKKEGACDFPQGMEFFHPLSRKQEPGGVSGVSGGNPSLGKEAHSEGFPGPDERGFWPFLQG